MQTLSNDIDLLHPPADVEKRKHKLKRLVQTPNSFFMVLIFFCFNFYKKKLIIGFFVVDWVFVDFCRM